MKTQGFGITAAVLLIVVGLGTGSFLLGQQDSAEGLKEGLVLYFSFDAFETQGNLTKVADLSGTGNDGFVTGGALVDGKFGKALECKYENQGDGVIVADSNSLDLDAVTIAAWIKTSRLDDQWSRILDKGWATAYNLCIGGEFKGQRWQDKCTFECAGCSTISKGSVVDGLWHFIVATNDGQFKKIYIDGKLDTKHKCKEKMPMKHTDTVLTIGRLAVLEVPPYEKSFFDGLIDEIRLYNRVLSDEEIQALAQHQP
jgi:hypothetical protein